jgi:hypothetical protein
MRTSLPNPTIIPKAGKVAGMIRIVKGKKSGFLLS